MNTNVILFTLLLCYCGASATFTNPPPNYGTGSFNLNWSYLQYYGDQQPNATINVIGLPNDFIISLDGDSLFVADAATQQIKQFAKNSFGSFNNLYNYSFIIFSLEQTGQNTLAFGLERGLLLDTAGQTANLYASESTSAINLPGLCYDGDQTLYVSVPVESRVLALNLSDNGTIVRVYGKTNISDISQILSNPNITNMATPWHLRLDCEGNLWVVDFLFLRIMRYKAGTTTADLVWGQADFTAFLGVRYEENGFFAPRDIVFDAACTVAFVADSSRILLFRAPFVSNQSAEGVLGATNLTSAGSFGFIARLQLEDRRNNSGLLYILDNMYKRIVVGRVEWYSNIVSSFICSNSSLVGYECVVQQAVSLAGVVNMPANYAIVKIQSSLKINTATQVVMGSQQQIQTQGQVELAGQLTVVISAEDKVALEQTGRIEKTLITTNSTVSGQFERVTIEGEGETECGVKKEDKYGGRSMGVLVTKEVGCNDGKTEEKGGLSGGAIAGIVIGAVGGLLLCAAMIGGAVIGVMKIKQRNKHSGGSVNL